MSSRFDSVVIGTGQAGPSLAARLAGAGQRVAVVERKLFGGTCVNNGCIPTKTLVASARAAWVARRAADWGVFVDGPIEDKDKRLHARDLCKTIQDTSEEYAALCGELARVEEHATIMTPLMWAKLQST